MRAPRRPFALPYRTWRLAINNRHVAEVRPRTFECRLSDAVLTSDLIVIDSDHRRRDAGKNHRVRGELIPHPAPVPGRPGTHGGSRPSGFHPDLHGVSRGKLRIGSPRREALAAVRVG